MATRKSDNVTAIRVDEDLPVIDRIIAEDTVKPYRLTADWTITPPTFEQAEAMDGVKDIGDKVDVWLGAGGWARFQDVLKTVPVHLVPKVLDDFVSHFFGDDTAQKFADSFKAAQAAALDKIDLTSEG